MGSILADLRLEGLAAYRTEALPNHNKPQQTSVASAQVRITVENLLRREQRRRGLISRSTCSLIGAHREWCARTPCSARSYVACSQEVIVSCGRMHDKPAPLYFKACAACSALVRASAPDLCGSLTESAPATSPAKPLKKVLTSTAFCE